MSFNDIFKTLNKKAIICTKRIKYKKRKEIISSYVQQYSNFSL